MKDCGHNYLRVVYNRTVSWAGLYSKAGLIDATPDEAVLDSTVYCGVCGAVFYQAEDLPEWAKDKFSHLFVTGVPPVAPIAPLPQAEPGSSPLTKMSGDGDNTLTS